MGFGRIATRRLTQVSLELMPRRGARRWLLRSVLILGALGAGAAAGVVGRDQAMAAMQAPPPVVDAVAAQMQPLRHEVDQTRLALRLSTARSQELERQVDSLNQRLREATEELSFFRKAREARQ